MPETNTIVHHFHGLSIWEHFIKTGTPENIAFVNSHVEFAMPLLDQYTNAFPKYTLHNNRHQKNILKLMGNLLGNGIENLSPLESSMLILSTVYHDIGMVYSDNELQNISNEPKFQIFLDHYTQAKLEYEENNKKPTNNLIEWYCRWMHATRVWVYLNKVNTTIPLRWENISIKESLGFLCESHNYSVEEIVSKLNIFKNDYLGKCDLVFCAILLRLADILDFDNSRTPKSVYEFLELEHPKNKLDGFSKIEWEKHLNSNGFEFIRENDNLKVIFSATTPHPNIEIAIKNFIQIINSELIACQKLQKHCSKKWKEHIFPDEIDIENLSSENYQSGNYHFSLSEEKILTLLTGEEFYNDDFIFIRELLQNAIDTSRHREFVEKVSNPKFKVEPIKVSFFTDKQGYQWIRIDDFGMGMNEEIIVNHLLKKGESYYNSDKFKLEKINLNNAINKDFVPISRFGIGLLSCFLAGDRIEISTKYYLEQNVSIRLGIEGRNSSYVYQTNNKNHVPQSMPNQSYSEEGYRNDTGTSIAVRITTNKEFIGFDIQKELEKFILCSPIPILFEGHVIGGELSDLISKPWAKNEVISIDKTFVKKVEESFKVKFVNGININIEHINLEDEAFSENLKGQLTLLAVDSNYISDQLIQTLFKDDLSIYFRYDSNRLILRFFRREESKSSGRSVEIKEEIDISYILDKLNFPNILTCSKERKEFKQGIYLSHNGIVINDSKNIFSIERYNFNTKGKFYGHSNKTFVYFGIFYFQDNLLPDLTVSRNDIKRLPYTLMANLSFSLEKLNKYVDTSNKFCFFEEKNSYYTSSDVHLSGFYYENKKFLDDFIKIDTIDGILSLNELAEKVLTTKTEFTIFRNGYRSEFYNILVCYALEQNFQISVSFEGLNNRERYFIDKKVDDFPRELQMFSPFTFLNFDNNSEKLNINQMLNINHPYIKWYIKAFDLLVNDYFYYSQQLIFIAINKEFNDNVEKIKQILNRLEAVLPHDLKPSKNINITKQDFGDIQ